MLNLLEAAFWVEVVVTIFQLAGWDRFLNFDKLGQAHFLGTVMQYMRFSSVLVVLTPFLVARDWRYIFLIGTLAIVSQSSSFAFSLLAGIGAFFLLTQRTWEQRAVIVISGLILGAGYAVYDWGSFQGAIVASNGGRLSSWGAALRTWVFDTIHVIPGWPLIGPFQWKWLLFGHGLDTFMYLFPVYKHDPNPFGQAHNFYIQMGWECGIVGLGIVLWYAWDLICRLYRGREFGALSGLAMILTNLLFCFPERQTQSALLLVAYLAICERCWMASRPETRNQ